MTIIEKYYKEEKNKDIEKVLFVYDEEEEIIEAWEIENHPLAEENFRKCKYNANTLTLTFYLDY